MSDSIENNLKTIQNRNRKTNRDYTRMLEFNGRLAQDENTPDQFSMPSKTLKKITKCVISRN